MVRRLVEQQHLRVADEQLRQRDAHLPAARELAGGARQVDLLEAQAEEHASHLRLDGVAAQRLVGVARAAGGGQLRLGGVLPQLGLQPMQALFGLQNLHLGGHDLFEDGAFLHLDGFLLQVPHARAFGEQHPAFVGVLLAGNDIEQGGLAGPVGTHERQALVLFQAERHVLEERAAAE